MEIILILAVLVLFIVVIFQEVIIPLIFGLLAIIILPFAAIFDAIASRKKAKKDRRDAPTVWRRKR